MTTKSLNGKMYLTVLMGLLLLISMISCSKDRAKDDIKDAKSVDELANGTTSDVNTNERITDYTSVAEFLEVNKPKVQTFSFSASENIIAFTGEKGSDISIDRNILVKPDGSAVTGSVDVEFIEVLTPGDMILAQKFTTSGGQLLQSGGQYFLSLTSEGEQLSSNGYYTANLPTDAPLSPMIVFEGVENAVGFDWASVDSTQAFVEVLQNEYSMFVPEFNWINCDYWTNGTGPITDISIVPCDIALESFNVFLAFPSINSVMPTNPDAATETFIGQNVLQGIDAIAVGIGIDANGQLFLGSANFTATAGETVQLNCISISEEDLLAFLATLG